MHWWAQPPLLMKHSFKSEINVKYTTITNVYNPPCQKKTVSIFDRCANELPPSLIKALSILKYNVFAKHYQPNLKKCK